MGTPPDKRLTFGPYTGLTYRSAKRFILRQFTEAGLPFADEDALDLILGLTGLSHADYAIRGAENIPDDQLEHLRDAVERRLGGEPVDRILGYRDFFGRRFRIDNVLSPRGDTEVLLLAAIDALRNRQDATVLDLGTGSGALAISLLCEKPELTVTATDISKAALITARANAENHKVGERIHFLQSNWYAALGEAQFDAILSNPPYIDMPAIQALPREVASYDPALALSGGTDGLDAYRVIIPGAVHHLRPGGWLGLEIGYDQGEPVSRLMAETGFTDISILPDPAGHDRVVKGYRA